MANKASSLAHTKWMCKYHFVFTPKYRRKAIFKQYKQSIKEILVQRGVEQSESQRLEALVGNKAL
ncbi:hypothetical protein FACS189481_5370 [Clostridia bacterium]|nr:hypothetical protein FACS189481_5370 [Clostridia bacterium]